MAPYPTQPRQPGAPYPPQQHQAVAPYQQQGYSQPRQSAPYPQHGGGAAAGGYRGGGGTGGGGGGGNTTVIVQDRGGGGGGGGGGSFATGNASLSVVEPLFYRGRGITASDAVFTIIWRFFLRQNKKKF